MSWHYNFYKDKSIINEMVDLIGDNRYLMITMRNGDCFKVVDSSWISIGQEAMMIARDDEVSFINTNYILYVRLIGADDKHYKQTLHKSENVSQKG